MKKIVIMCIALFCILPVSAKTDKTSAEYLKNKKHFAIMNPLTESVAQKVIKKSLQKEIGKGNYKVNFEGYTLSSMKRGIFKTLEITGKDMIVEEIPVRYLNLKTLTDYNWIDFRESPVKIKSDTIFAYKLELTDSSINAALKQKEYQKKINKVNKIAYPLFAIYDTRIKIRHDKVHIIMDYNFPIAPHKKNKTFVVSTKFKVENGKILAHNVGIDNSYGNLPIDKVTNLINLLDPLTFALDILNDEKCNGRIENVNIDDNIIQIDGKIFLKGEK